MNRFTRSIISIFLLCSQALAGSAAWAQLVPMACDADNNGVIDVRDVQLITAARNKPASGPTDPRDPNRDGIINVLDARFCAIICTFPLCAKAPAIPAPVANAGAEQQVAVGATVELNGSASTSARGDTLTYAWSILSKPAGSTAVLVNPTAVRPTFVADQQGLYDIELTVTDAHGVASNQATMLVAAGAATVPPAANPGGYPIATVGGQVVLDGTQSTSVSGAPLLNTWQFFLVPSQSTAVISDNTAVNPSFVTDLPGQYYVRLNVLDANYNSATANVVIDTQQRTRAPTANAGPAQWAVPGQTVVLSGLSSVVPGGGAIAGYQWVMLARPTGSAAQLSNPAAPGPSFVVDVAGDYVVQLIVTANGLASAPTTVLVSTRDVPPIASAGLPQSVYAGDTAYLHGTGTAPDGSALTYRWSLIDTPFGFATVPVNGANTANPSFATGLAGTYVAQLIVNNGHVDSVPSTTVIQANTPTTADLSLTLAANTASPLVGGNVQFTVTVTNLGPLAATSATVSDLLPPGLQFVAAAPSQGFYNSATGAWTVGPLARNGSAQLLLTAGVSGTTALTDTAAVIASAPTDPNVGNNAASVSVTPIQGASLSIVTAVNNATPLVGSNVVFTTTVTNNGPAAATGAQVADLLPSGFALVSSQASVGSYQAGTGVWTIGSLPNGAAATLSITATVLGSGSYTDSAGVTAANSPNTGPNVTSTISVAPRFPPTVSITAPASGARYIVPANVSLTVSTSSSSGLVAQLALYDGTKLIQSVPVNLPAVTFTFSLNGVPAGTHSYTAVATDGQGLSATSNPVAVTVVAPTATAVLLAPANNSFFVAPATITLLAAAVSSTGTVAQVLFFEDGSPIGSAAHAPYSLTLTGVGTGTHTFSVQVTDSTSTVSSSTATVTIGAASTLTVTAPSNGASIADAVISTLSGTVRAPPNSSIVVNGLPAALTTDGRFFVNNVPLLPGSNTIQVTLTEPNGMVTTQSLNVTSTGTQPFQAATNVTGPNSAMAGLAPLAVEFTVSDPGKAAATSATLSCSNNGTVDYSISTLDLSGDANSIGVCTYTAPGVYTALISVVNSPSGQPAQTVYTGTLTIVVSDTAALDAMLRSAWSGMNDALLAGDQARALSYLDDPARATYSPVFTGLAAQMPGIIASYSDLSQGFLSPYLAEYLLVRTIQGAPQAFLIYFVNTGGVWQLDAM